MKATDLAYVRYQTPDLTRLETFLRDFGMHSSAPPNAERLLMRGSGTAPFIYEAVLGSEPRFLGAGLQVSSRADLAALARLPGSSPVEALTGLPGGGERVRMRMPDGFEIDALHGAAPAQPLHLPRVDDFNAAAAKPRKNVPVRVAR